MKRNILNKVVVYGALVLATFTTSCASKRNAAVSKKTKAETEMVNNSIRSFEMNNLTFHSFSGRAKAKIKMDNNTHDATAHIRMQKDKAIWISVTALLNIEVARVLITPDSVQILTKFPKRESIKKPFSYIYQYTNPGVSFSTLQDVLIGNLSTDLLRSEGVQVATADEEVIIAGKKNDLSFQYGMNELKRPFATRLADERANQQLEVSYGDFGTFDGYVFPQRFVLKVAGEGVDILANLQYNRVTFNESLDMPF